MRSIHVLIADDDEDDCMLAKKALHCVYKEPLQITTVSHGGALLAYLDQCTTHNELNFSPMPDLILLDINMPYVDGREALSKLRSNPRYQTIPIIVLTTSDAQDDINLAYNLGANSYISKVLTFNDMMTTMTTFMQYWFNTVKLPHH